MSKKRHVRQLLRKTRNQFRATAILNEKIESIKSIKTREKALEFHRREHPDIDETLEEEELRHLLEETLSAKASLEDKAKALVATLTIAAALCTGLYGVVEGFFSACLSRGLKALIALLAIACVGLMVAAALKSISIFVTKISVHTVDVKASDRVLELAKCIKANRWENIIRSNELADAFVCLRFSLLALLALFVILVIVA